MYKSEMCVGVKNLIYVIYITITHVTLIST